ncbi:sel1 repeat family protein [Bacillus sp. S35]|uniref:tetratricopeptide repeat protein n=1 Tax=Priestia aryabhattai TaxID=412384 RepID=UPI00190D3BF8|nr:tetratricopeptide repeat protein [Priestia aryabhattai]MBK0009733.1 sel1 repeat family protein [Bacillus sp. S35]MCM3644457.1 sel1 repeat family protein [Priestia aryabhattai]
MKYWEKGEYWEARDHFEKAAKLGSYEAQKYLADLYNKGVEELNIKPNYTKALRWLEKLAELGDEEAQYECAYYYYCGLGTSKNFERAFDYALQSAEAGNNDALRLTGVLYLKGNGVEKNEEKAIEYIRRAAIQDDLYAQMLLCDCYLCYPKYDEALKYLRIVEVKKSELNEEGIKEFERMKQELSKVKNIDF